jgi:hypothetical protein
MLQRARPSLLEGVRSICRFPFVLSSVILSTQEGRQVVMAADPAPAYVPREDTELFKVTVPGWYAFDDDHIPLLGPFNSREECVEAIRSAGPLH